MSGTVPQQLHRAQHSVILTIKSKRSVDSMRRAVESCLDCGLQSQIQVCAALTTEGMLVLTFMRNTEEDMDEIADSAEEWDNPDQALQTILSIELNECAMLAGVRLDNVVLALENHQGIIKHIKGGSMGPYDNEIGRYLNPEGFMDGHWYLDEEGQLFIVPNAEAEIEGPDGEVLDALNRIYREQTFTEIDQNIVAEQLYLEVVLEAFKRFEPGIGFYTA